jgi:hypothetical protein
MKTYASWYEILKLIRNHVGARGMVGIKFVDFFHLFWTWIPMTCRWVHFVTWKIYLNYFATITLTWVRIGKLFHARNLHITWSLLHIPSLLLPTLAQIINIWFHRRNLPLFNIFIFFFQLITLTCIIVVVGVLSCHHHCEVCV